MNTVLSALYTNIIWPLRDRLSREEGLEAVEYALIAALLSAIVVAAVALLSPEIENAYQAIANQLTGAAGEMNGPADPAAP